MMSPVRPVLSRTLPSNASLPEQCGIHASNGVPLHLRRDVRVRIRCSLDAAMPKPLTHDLKMDTRLEERRSVRVLTL